MTARRFLGEFKPNCGIAIQYPRSYFSIKYRPSWIGFRHSMGGRKVNRMFELFLSIAAAFMFCYIFMSLLAYCKTMNDAINSSTSTCYESYSSMSQPGGMELEPFDLADRNLESDIDFGKPYAGWSDEQIETYEKNHLRYDILN